MSRFAAKPSVRHFEPQINSRLARDVSPDPAQNPNKRPALLVVRVGLSFPSLQVHKRGAFCRRQ
jgi:hypothetical protein